MEHIIFSKDSFGVADYFIIDTTFNASGTFTEEAQVVPIYSQDEEDNTDNDVAKGENNNQNRKLPDTGEVMFGQLLMITTGLLTVSLGLFLIYRRRKNKVN